MTYAAPSFEAKICPPEQLTARAAQIARPLVFTNGCFDILHRGHVTYLAQAAALGVSMVVALNSACGYSTAVSILLVVVLIGDLVRRRHVFEETPSR